MATIAAAADVSVRWGRTLTTEENLLVVKRLEDAERLILKRIPDLVAQIAATTIDVEDVKQVEAEAVLRLVRNPDGYISETDGDYTYQLSQSSAFGKLRIEPDEWELLGWVQGIAILVPTFVMPS